MFYFRGGAMPCKILLVEGDDLLRELLFHMAAELCVVQSTADAIEAARALEADRFDIINPGHG